MSFPIPVLIELFKIIGLYLIIYSLNSVSCRGFELQSYFIFLTHSIVVFVQNIR